DAQAARLRDDGQPIRADDARLPLRPGRRPRPRLREGPRGADRDEHFEDATDPEDRELRIPGGQEVRRAGVPQEALPLQPGRLPSDLEDLDRGLTGWERPTRGRRRPTRGRRADRYAGDLRRVRARVPSGRALRDREEALFAGRVVA